MVGSSRGEDCLGQDVPFKNIGTDYAEMFTC